MDFRMDLDPTDNNSEAGPSWSKALSQQPEASTSAMTILPIFPPPPPPSTNAPAFSAAQDLIGLFQLQTAYDKYVKPHVLPVDQWQTAQGGNTDKGKGKEKEPEDVDMPMDAASPNDPSSTEGKKRKKESSYRHLIRAVVGMYLLILLSDIFVCHCYVSLIHITRRETLDEKGYIFGRHHLRSA